MNTTNLTSSLATLLSELVDGTPPTGGYMLNKNDVGLLRALDTLSTAEASTIVNGGSSIAAHVDHLTYGISLMNRWAAGENPWRSADWAASWRRPSVTDQGWEKSRRALGDQLHQWLAVIKEPREVEETELTGMISTIAHLAYHLGAIRQMDRKIRGPSANNEQDAFTAPASRP
ncbi:MAG TPA: DinB family protein [Gemmatimonadaceae bacterium]